MKVLLILIVCSLLSACSTAKSTGHATNSHSALESRLISLGYSEEDAAKQVASLSTEELNYLNDNPEQVKKSGIIILLGLSSSSYHSHNQKKANENLQEQVNELRMKDEVERQVEEKLKEAE